MTSKADARSETLTDTSTRSSIRGRLAVMRLPGLTVRGLRIPTWAVLLGGYGVSRAVVTGLMWGAFALASSQGWSVAHFDGSPGLLGYLQSWDGLYYRQIALSGYPLHLPVNSFGNVTDNPWAFLPLYPMLVRGVMLVTGLDFGLAGVLVAALFGLGATFALHRVLLIQFGRATAIWGALFFCFGPMSFVFQVTYADSVFLFFMFCGLAAMMSRRYLLLIPFGIAACFAHPGAIALAAAIGIQSLIRLLHREHFPLREKLAAAASIVAIIAATVAWPLIAARVTGDPSAYFDSELAWWSGYLGQASFLPFTPWFMMAGHYWGAAGILLVLAVLVGFVWWIANRRNRVLGVDILAYTGSYVAYLVAVFLPQQSFFRMLLPLSPLLGHPALSRSPRRRRITFAISVLLLPLGILLFWVIWPP